MLNPYIKKGDVLSFYGGFPSQGFSQMGAPAQQSCAASAWEKAGEMAVIQSRVPCFKTPFSSGKSNEEPWNYIRIIMFNR